MQPMLAEQHCDYIRTDVFYKSHGGSGGDGGHARETTGPEEQGW